MSDARPNVVLVTADSLRADYCGYVGGGELTPTLDRLAGEGVAFSNAIAPGPQTFSSMPAAFTGEPRDPSVYRNREGEDPFERRLGAIADHLDRYAPIQERLQDLGYETAAVTPNPWTSRAAGFHRGFDRFVDCSAVDRDGRLDAVLDRLPGLERGAKPVELLANKLAGRSFFATWESLYDDLLEARAALSEPYFLWVFLMDTHIPYIARRAHREENSLPAMYYAVARSQGALRGHDDGLPAHVRRLLLRSYRDTVRATDAFLDRLRSDLDDHVLVFHADHGESLGEHDTYGHHHRRVYEENVHVPYVVHGAGATGRVERPTSLVTLHDAVYDLARRGTFDPSRYTATLVAASSELLNHRAVRGRRWKYVEDDGTRQLFDLWADPGEHRDVAAANPALVDELARRLESTDQHRRERARIRESADELVGEADV